MKTTHINPSNPSNPSNLAAFAALDGFYGNPIHVRGRAERTIR